MKLFALGIVAVVFLVGCESPSTRLAIDGANRAMAVQSWAVDRQHREIVRLLFNSARQEIKGAGVTDDARDVTMKQLNRDLWVAAFWQRQFDAAKSVLIESAMSKLEASRGRWGLVSESLKARIESLAPVEVPPEEAPEEAPPPADESATPVSMNLARPSSDWDTRRFACAWTEGAEEAHDKAARESAWTNTANAAPAGFWNAGKWHSYGELPVRLK